MRKLVLLAGVVALWLLSMVPAPAGARTVPVNDRLLTVSTLGTAWKVQSTDRAKLPASDCLADPLKGSRGQRAQVTFVKGPGIPTLAEQIALDQSTSSGTYRAVRSKLAACRSVAVDDQGIVARAAVRPLPLPQYGRATSGYQVAVPGADAPLTIGVALVRTSDALAIIELEQNGPVTALTLAPFLKAAVAKL
jgi:hypothetical protein